MENYPKVSVIIAASRKEPLYGDSLKHQDYSDYEIISVSGYAAAKARNIALNKAKGEIFAFIDDDVVLPNNWISKGVSLLRETGADIVGGPNIGFPDATLGERLSDMLISSRLLNGMRRQYRRAGQPGFFNYKNFATCNLMAYRTVFEKIGPFNEQYRYTEDMEFLLRSDLKRIAKYHSPEFFLYHKRRSFPWSHMKQIFFWGYGNMQLACDYGIIFKRTDMWLSLLILPIGLIFLYFFFKPVLLISLLLFPLSVHFLSYACGAVVGFFVFYAKKRRPA